MKKYLILPLLIVIFASNLLAEGSKDFDLSSASTTPKALEFIRVNYIDQARANPFEMLKAALNQVQKGVAEILVTFDGGNKFTITLDKATKKFSPKELKTLADLWAVLDEVYLFIQMHYHGTLDKQDIEYMAIDGMLSALDPHSNILTPKIFKEFKVGTKGKFGGIGIVIGSKEGNLTVIAPIEDTPAWRAGMKAGDHITQIGEESTVNMSLTEAVELLRGDVGKDVTITVERKGRPAPFNVTLKRAIIKIESVQSELIPVGNRNVGYIKIKNFQEDTGKEFSKQLGKLRAASNFSGLIIDLRNDPGGLLSQAVDVVDKFIPSGVIVSTVGAGSTFIDQEVAGSQGTEPAYPIIALVNEGSASASEIVAGTLQSYDRALIMGTQSFGKGSVQSIFDLHDGSALKLTIAEYLTAGKNSIQTVGVTPDIMLVPEKIDKNEMDIAEDEHENESSLEGHLTKYSANVKGESRYKLDYFQPTEKEDEEEAGRREYSKKLDLKKDLATLFAAKIIANAPTDAHEDLAKSAAPTITAIEKEQKALVAAELSKAGIDWSDCKSSARSSLQVTFSMQKNGENITKAIAGDETDLTLTATNVGSGQYCQLIGIIDAKDHALKNKEFVFGKLPVGASKSWSAKFKVPKTLPTQGLPFTVKFSEENGNKPSEFKAIVPIEGLKQPQFAFTYKLGVPEKTKVVNEPMPVGKTIPFYVDVKNVGKGPALNAVAIIKNDSDTKGVFIDTGRVKIGKLEPGQKKRLTFKFKIEPSLSKSTFKLEFTVVDQDLYTSLSKKIEFNVGSGIMEPPFGLWYEAPRISFEGTRFPIVTSAAKVHIEGDIKDDKKVKDYFIFVGDDKVAYASNPEDTGKFKIIADLPVKEGNNLISVIARDELDLISRFNFVVERK